MMAKIFCLLAVLLLSGLVEVNSLQCYVCFNCTTTGADDLRTCGDLITTTQIPTTTTQATTTTTQGTPTTPQGTPTSTQTTSATKATTTPTQSTTIATPTQATTTTTQSTTITTPTTTTTQVPTITTEFPITQVPTTHVPTTHVPTTQVPTTQVPTTQVPTTTSQSTTITTPTTTSTIPAPVNQQVQSGLNGRSKRNVLYPVSIRNPEECPCINEPECECDDNLRKKRSILQYEDIEYVCYKISNLVNNETIIERGCAPAKINNATLCELDVIKNSTTSCNICKTNKCNGSYTVQYSIALLAASVVMLFLNK